MDATQVDRFVAEELDGFLIDDVREWAEDFLVPATNQVRQWEYGSAGTSVNCWIVAVIDKKWGIAFSQEGHGPDAPWGVVQLDDWSSCRMDSYWFARLEDAFIAAGWKGPLPDDYQVE